MKPRFVGVTCACVLLLALLFYGCSSSTSATPAEAEIVGATS